MKDLFDVQQLSQFEFGAIIITILIAGLVFGCLLAYAILKRKDRPNAEAAAAIKEEFEEYKDKVDDHFNKTSEMFKDVTTQYKKLYDHMAVGAIELSKADTITMPRLEMQDSDEPAAGKDQAVIDESSDDVSLDESLESGEDLQAEETADRDSDKQSNVEDNAEQKSTKAV